MEAPIRNRVSPDSVALTFDDGPSQWTSAVLSELARAGAHASFFVNPATKLERVREIADAGHEVGYHCRQHVRHTERREPDVREEARGDLDLLASLGIRPRAWRTPWGDLAPWSKRLAAELGLELWHWSDDTHDWDGRDAARMLSELERALEPGSVVLMHDGVGPGALRSDVSATIELVVPLVELCRERGLEPGPLVATEPLHV